MSEDLFDRQSIEIPCPRCGHKARKTIARLRNHADYTCAGCGAVIRPEPDKLLRGLEAAKRELRKMVASLRKPR